MVTRLVAGIVVLCVGASPARGEPCTEQLGLVAGDVAPCDGVIVPPDIPDACSSTTASLMSCRRRIAGEREEHAVILRARDERIALLEQGRDDERAACRDQVSPPPTTNWTAVAWGVVGGVVLGGILTVAVAAATQ